MRQSFRLFDAGHVMHMAFEDIRPARLIEQPEAPRPRRRSVSPGTAAIVAILFAAGLVLVAGRDPSPSPPAPAVVAAPAPEWVPIDNPLQLFDLSAPSLAHLAETYSAARHRPGGGRRDILTFGALDGQSPYLHLSLYRVGREKVADIPLFVDLVRLGAGIDLAIVRSTNPAILPTKFGPFETADVDLVAGTGKPIPCLGFRGSGLGGQFRLTGLACGTRAFPMSGPAFACLIDRLQFDGGGDDRALVGFFDKAELNRNATCTGTELAPNPARTSWIDRNDAPPPLKLRKMR